jgi:hypothetical protein
MGPPEIDFPSLSLLFLYLFPWEHPYIPIRNGIEGGGRTRVIFDFLIVLVLYTYTLAFPSLRHVRRTGQLIRKMLCADRLRLSGWLFHHVGMQPPLEIS